MANKKKRIAMVVFNYYPFDPRVRREAEGLTEAGLSVDVICLKQKEEAFREMVNKVNIWRIPLEKRNKPGRFHYLWEYFSFLIFAFFLLSILHIRKRFNIVHVHNMPDVLVLSALIPRLTGSKIILDLHDPMPEVFMAKYPIEETHLSIRLLRLMEKFSIWFSNIVLTPNIAFRELFCSRGCPETKIHVIMNSPQESIFYRTKNKTNLNTWSDETFIMMYHGTIAERNGLGVALEALSLLRTKIPNIVMKVYGDGDFREEALQLVDELGLKDIVNYCGVVSAEEIASAIESVHLGLIPNKPSTHWDHAMPTRLFEYLSLGKPAIVPKTKGILDYFDEGSLYFFEPGNADSLLTTILNVYNNPSKVQIVLDKGIEIYEKHSWEKEKQKLIKIVIDLFEEDELAKLHKLSFKKIIYYYIRPLLPLKIRWILQKKYAQNINGFLATPTWPISDNIKFEEIVWPKENKIPFVLTHDVDSQFGFDNIKNVCEIEKKMNLKSTWFIVPNLYKIRPEVIDYLYQSGMEVGVHDWNHDGKLFSSRRIFNKRREKINQTIKSWGAKGFRSGSAFHNDRWMPELECEYDSSYYDTDPFQPLEGGSNRITPFMIGNLVELPYTMPQDHVLYVQNAQVHINMNQEIEHIDDANLINFFQSWCRDNCDSLHENEKEKRKSRYSIGGIDIWKMKTSWLFKQNSMVLMLTHPDYLCHQNLNIDKISGYFKYGWLNEKDEDIQEVRDKGIITETWYGSLLEQYAAFLNWFKREFDGAYYNHLSWELADWFKNNKNIVHGNKK